MSPRPSAGLMMRVRGGVVKVARAVMPLLSVAAMVLAPGVPTVLAVPGTIWVVERFPPKSIGMAEVFQATPLKVRDPIGMVAPGVNWEPVMVTLAPETSLLGVTVRGRAGTGRGAVAIRSSAAVPAPPPPTGGGPPA